MNKKLLKISFENLHLKNEHKRSNKSNQNYVFGWGNFLSRSEKTSIPFDRKI